MVTVMLLCCELHAVSTLVTTPVSVYGPPGRVAPSASSYRASTISFGVLYVGVAGSSPPDDPSVSLQTIFTESRYSAPFSDLSPIYLAPFPRLREFVPFSIVPSSVPRLSEL